jgi:Copper chaperone
MATRKFKISGMKCSHCENNVKNSLMALQGIETAIPNKETSTVEVTGSVINPTEIEKAIKDIGFIYEGES